MKYASLTREELIERLEAAESARRDLEADQLGVEHQRVLHELQVHQLELEAQNQALREAQGHVEESRSRYADLYDFAPIPYCTFNQDGVVLEINLTGASILGVERSRIVGKQFARLVHLASPGSFARHIRTSLESSIPVVSAIAFSTDRGPFEFQLVSTAVRSPHGPPRSCRTAFLDITQLRLAERDARAAHGSERVLRARLEGIDRASVAVSAALARLSGPDIDDFLQVIVDQAGEAVGAEYAALGIGGGDGQKFEKWVFSGVSPGQVTTIGRTPRGVGLLGAVIHAGRPIRLRDIREHGAFLGFPVHHPPMTSFLGVPIRYQGESRGNLYLANKRGADEFTGEDQSLIEMLADRVGSAMEIARLREYEARDHVRLALLAKAGPALAESIDYEKTLAAIAKLLIPDAADLSAIDLLEDDGALTRVAVYHPDPRRNQLLERLEGTWLVDDVPEDIRAAIATEQPQRRDLTPEFLKAGVPDTEHREILRQMGATCVISAPLSLPGRVIGVLRLIRVQGSRRYCDDDLLLAREIAQHAALAIENARLYRAAQRATLARDNLLAVVSHDLRNYLATICTGAEVLLWASSAGEPCDGRKQVKAIRRSATRMQQLIESLRDATMLETGELTIETKIEDVAALVEEALNTLEPQAEAASLRLKAQLDSPLPAVICDRARVLQVIVNLVGNAIKFTDAGGEICIAASPTDHEAVCISVSDTGRGIPERQLPHVFERHWKGQAGNRTGTGLGLFIARGIVEAHGGTICVESAIGVGTTFSFTLRTNGRR